MGTSQAYDAPSTPQWRALKTAVTRLAKRGGVTPDEAGRLLSSFMRVTLQDGMGPQDPDSTEKTSSTKPFCEEAALQTALALAALFEAFGRKGVAPTLEQRVQAPLSDPRDVVFALVNQEAPAGNTLDDVGARYAMLSVLEELLGPDLSLEDAFMAATSPERLYELLKAFFGGFYLHALRRAFYEQLTRKANHDEALATLTQMERRLTQALDAIPHPTPWPADWTTDAGEAALRELCAAVQRALTTLR